MAEGMFSDSGHDFKTSYGDVPGFGDAYGKLVQQLSGLHSDSWENRQAVVGRLNSVVDQFKNLYKNNVGRDATSEEIGKYISESGADAILKSPNGVSENNAQAIRNQTAQYIGDTFQQAAQDTATQKTSDLTSKYSSLADQYMEMGKKSLGNLSDELKSYSTSLFEKLRPQLNLAAQAGGYADSGGQTLQEQGALTDLANQGRGVLANAAYGVENNANNIRYGGMAAPVSMASEFAANTPYATSALGAGGLNFNNQGYMTNLNYDRQMQARAQANNIFQDQQPSFGRSLSQSFANSFGNLSGQAAMNGVQGLAGSFRMPPGGMMPSGGAPLDSPPPVGLI